jgi:DNA-binding beta-propeller fold protein YncE
VVATASYADPALAGLGAAARNAEQLAGVLRDPEIGAFDVTLVIDGGEREIRERVEDFLAVRGREDVVVVYLSCRGVVDARDRLYFAAADTVQSRLASTAVESGWLADRLEECPAARQVVVILDCCFGGGPAPGTELRLGGRLAGHGRGRAVLAASWVAEESPEGGVSSPSVFTRFLAQGLRTGAADADRDGYISVDDAYNYAYEQAVAVGAGHPPQRYVSGGEGALWLARNPAPGLLDAGDGLRRSRWKTRTMLLALGASAVAAAALTAAFIMLNGPSGTPHTSGVKAVSGKAVGVYSAARYGFRGPMAIVADGSQLWVVNGNSVTELDAADGRLTRIVSALSYGFSFPDAIAADGADIWVANSEGDSVIELNAADGRLVRKVSVGGYAFSSPASIAASGADVWVTNERGDSVTELNAADGRVVRTVSVGNSVDDPSVIAADGADVWVASEETNRVTELNAADGTPVRTLSGGSYRFDLPDAIAAGGADVWVANGDGNSVTELNAADGSLIRTLSGPGYGFTRPAAIAVAGTHVWVANAAGNSVTELNASNGTPVRTFSGASCHFDSPDAIAVDGAGVWVANYQGASVTELPAG